MMSISFMVAIALTYSRMRLTKVHPTARRAVLMSEKNLMKKHHFVFAIVCPIAATAHAQSSVTLYGLIDEGIEAVSNVAVPGKSGGHTRFGLDAINGLNGTRWGLRGSEDLGGGLSAVFTLENG